MNLKNIKYLKSIIILIIIVNLIPSIGKEVQAQLTIPYFNVSEIPTKYWASVGASASLNGGQSVSVSILDGFNDELEKKFRQYNVRYSIDLNKNFDAKIYTTSSYSGNVEKIKQINRYGAGLTYGCRLGKKVKLYLGNDTEYHSQLEKDYRIRNITALRFRFGKFKITKKVRVAYYTNGFLFYNIGGEPISQYFHNGEYLDEISPNGFHRGRLSINQNIYFGAVSLNIGYMYQQEFNLPMFPYQQINTVDIRSGKIKDKFSNYQVISVGLRYRIKSKSNKTKTSRIDDREY